MLEGERSHTQMRGGALMASPRVTDDEVSIGLDVCITPDGIRVVVRIGACQRTGAGCWARLGDRDRHSRCRIRRTPVSRRFRPRSSRTLACRRTCECPSTQKGSLVKEFGRHIAHWPRRGASGTPASGARAGAPRHRRMGRGPTRCAGNCLATAGTTLLAQGASSRSAGWRFGTCRPASAGAARPQARS